MQYHKDCTSTTAILLPQTNLNKGNKMYTKAEQVDAVYYEAAWDNNTHSEGCYALAVHAACELGGVEVQNANDDGSTSYAPSRTFEFDDSSSVYVSCGGTYVIEPSA